MFAIVAWEWRVEVEGQVTNTEISGITGNNGIPNGGNERRYENAIIACGRQRFAVVASAHPPVARAREMAIEEEGMESR